MPTDHDVANAWLHGWLTGHHDCDTKTITPNPWRRPEAAPPTSGDRRSTTDPGLQPASSSPGSVNEQSMSGQRAALTRNRLLALADLLENTAVDLGDGAAIEEPAYWDGRRSAAFAIRELVTDDEPSRWPRLRAFLNGVREFRSSWTTHYDDHDLLYAYDSGRELAHRLTFRHFDQNR